MIEFNINKRINIIKINTYLYKFKNKEEFIKEFDFQKGKHLGKGSFGIVKKCFSKIDDNYYAIK